MANFGAKLAVGLGAGFGVMLVSTLVFLPASYAMNSYIHRHWTLRLLAGVVAGCGSLFSILIMLFRWAPKKHYFGMFPLVEGLSVEGFWGGILNAVLHPILSVTVKEGAVDPEAVKGFADATKHLWAKRGETVVDTGIIRAARELAAVGSMGEWEQGMKALSSQMHQSVAQKPSPQPQATVAPVEGQAQAPVQAQAQAQ